MCVCVGGAGGLGLGGSGCRLCVRFSMHFFYKKLVKHECNRMLILLRILRISRAGNRAINSFLYEKLVRGSGLKVS